MFVLMIFYMLAWTSCKVSLKGDSKFVFINEISLVISALSVGMVAIHEIRINNGFSLGLLIMLSIIINAGYRDAIDEESEKCFMCMLTNLILASFIILYAWLY